LYLSTKIDYEKHITILCAGTDGTDGPTDAAGAVVDNETIVTAVKKNIEPQVYLQNDDSYHFFNNTVPYYHRKHKNECNGYRCGDSR